MKIFGNTEELAYCRSPQRTILKFVANKMWYLSKERYQFQTPEEKIVLL